MSSELSPFQSVAAVVAAIDRFFDRLVMGMLGLATGLGCQSAEVTPVTPVQPAVKSVASAPADAAVVPDAPTSIGDFNITFYYVTLEDEVAVAKATPAKPPANENEAAPVDPDEALAAAIMPPDTVTLYDEGCGTIAEVSREFASALELQGTGKLHDGRVLNIWGACNCGRSPCFKVTENQWGTSGSGRPLQPFRTVAVDPKVIKIGTLLHVPLLEGRMMPGRAPWGGFVHDGCVVADDTGGGIDGNQLDLFVGRKAYYLGISGSGGSHAWARHVPVFDGSAICERKGRKIGRKNAAI